MKFYPAQLRDNLDRYSIRWSAARSAFILTSSGQDLGDAIVSRDEWLRISNGDLTPLKETGLDINEIEARGYLEDSDVTGVDEIKMGISERKSINELPFGVFKLVETNDGLTFIPYSNNTPAENIIDNKNLKAQVKDFFENGFKGRKNKKGFLLFGPPGNGKTTEIMSLFSLCAEMQIRIFLVDGKLHLGYLHGAQKLLENERTLFIMEEVTERVNGRGIEHLLTFLDGENSWNNSIVIATTNYPEDLPANLVDRPGRFDTFIEYGNPTKEDIMKLAEKFEIPADEAIAITGRSLSFDYVSYMMALAKKEGVKLKEAIQKDEEAKRKVSSIFKGKIGIGG